MKYRLGIDIGSTTVKAVLVAPNEETIYSIYRRHHAHIIAALRTILQEIARNEVGGPVSVVMTGSGGINLSKQLAVPFVQEVEALSLALTRDCPALDVAIELGGEDAKIIYYRNGAVADRRMNGICAGGTGAFIDQMAALLQTDAAGLNELAKQYRVVYPIAARCGVFAKSDIQPLINDGAAREDLAASIFQAVVDQTVSGLACGKPIRGRVALLGGPLSFLSELRKAFIRTLKLEDHHAIRPADAHLFAALGAAQSAKKEQAAPMSELIDRLTNAPRMAFEINRLTPLFAGRTAYDDFSRRHAEHTVKRAALADYHGDCFLGVDAGSTTLKIALISADGALLYTQYESNQGKTLHTAMEALRGLRDAMPATARIARAAATGYGENLIKAAFRLDEGEVETVAHAAAARFFDPAADCILDIGGQDMKCMWIRDGVVDDVVLNEACSSGCGSFIENFAQSLDYNAADFAKEALFATHPVDLGTRCTVFMNSNVKQAQKEGAPVSDIAAGLACSVIKNALYKVIRIGNAQQLGRHIVVQGGTFLNDAVLRAFERETGCQVTRPDIAGLMGAFGAALIARERYEGQPSAMISLRELDTIRTHNTQTRCGGCGNHCRLSVHQFSPTRKYVSGNRCESMSGAGSGRSDVPNLAADKLKRLFAYEPLPMAQAKRGRIGMPRVLNVYENYPFWAVFFRTLGFHIQLSPASTREIYELGMDTVPSESACYPAKLSHGHVQWLLAQGVKTVFYPCVFYEHKEESKAQNRFNCPIVATYPENIRNNMEAVHTPGVRFLQPFLSFADPAALQTGLCAFMETEFRIPVGEVKQAIRLAWRELRAVREETRRQGEKAVRWLRENRRQGIVLAGRPYHLDPEINHGIPDMIHAYGVAVLTEDAVSHLAQTERPLRVNDQWVYHTRLYAAATFVKKTPELEMVQLTSFGCGLDAVTIDQVNEILNSGNKLHTLLKIDEVNNLGAARIRVRSLLAALRQRGAAPAAQKQPDKPAAYHRVEFTRRMRKAGYTILCPQMSPLHFDLLQPTLNQFDYDLKILDNHTRSAVETGLKYVHNDACYPSIVVVGQLMEAVLSGAYDTDRIALMMTQTGGACRASNYIAFIRRALEKANLAHIPVISLSANGMESNGGFRYSVPMLVKAGQALVYGDLLMKVLYRTRPYERETGAADTLHHKWRDTCTDFLVEKSLDFKRFAEHCRGIVHEFDTLPLKEHDLKPKVGIVGEIFVKYMPLANNHLVDVLEREGAEVVVPELMGFLEYGLFNGNFKRAHYNNFKLTARLSNVALRLIEALRRPVRRALTASRRFTPPGDIRAMAERTKPFLSLGNHAGEGWLLTAEMIRLIEEGVENIVCVQPFGCLPNHVAGKGVIQRLTQRFEKANIAAIDYDSGASEVNQINRIKLMLSTAWRNMEPGQPGLGDGRSVPAAASHDGEPTVATTR